MKLPTNRSLQLQLFLPECSSLPPLCCAIVSVQAAFFFDCTFQLLASKLCRWRPLPTHPPRPTARQPPSRRAASRLLPTSPQTSAFLLHANHFLFLFRRRNDSREPPGQRRGRERKEGREEGRAAVGERRKKKEVVVSVEEGEIMVGRRATNEPRALMEKTEGNQDTHQ